MTRLKKVIQGFKFYEANSMGCDRNTGRRKRSLKRASKHFIRKREKLDRYLKKIGVL